jgi:hypothetical protein
MRARVADIYRVEVARKAWVTCLQALVILLFVWVVYRALLRVAFGHW